MEPLWRSVDALTRVGSAQITRFAANKTYGAGYWRGAPRLLCDGIRMVYGADLVVADFV